jgi:hypothetical protein
LTLDVTLSLCAVLFPSRPTRLDLPFLDRNGGLPRNTLLRHFPVARRRLVDKVAALAVIHPADIQLTIRQHHLDSDYPYLSGCDGRVVPEGAPESSMMAQPVPHPTTDKKRVKVYELRNNDWFDRGTGFCTAGFATTEEGPKEPRVIVESEDQPERLLLETRIVKDDGFQKQQDTLIVWTDNGVDMALSFQEAEGCALIWFVPVLSP